MGGEIINSVYFLLTNQIEHLRSLEKLSDFDTLISDICNARLRYLSRSSQISISSKLDITKNYNRYGVIS